MSLIEATTNGIIEEEFVPQSTVHKIAREESCQQHKMEFRRLKDNIEKEITTKLGSSNINKRNNHPSNNFRQNTNTSNPNKTVNNAAIVTSSSSTSPTSNSAKIREESIGVNRLEMP